MQVWGFCLLPIDFQLPSFFGPVVCLPFYASIDTRWTSECRSSSRFKKITWSASDRVMSATPYILAAQYVIAQEASEHAWKYDDYRVFKPVINTKSMVSGLLVLILLSRGFRQFVGRSMLLTILSCASNKSYLTTRRINEARVMQRKNIPTEMFSIRER